MNRSKLPEGWGIKSLSQVGDINPRYVMPSRWGNSHKVAFVPMASIDETFGQVRFFESKVLNEVTSGKTRFVQNDILFAKITPCTENGKVAMAEEIPSEVGFGSTEFHIIHPHDRVMPRFLLFYLRTSSVREAVTASMTGTTGRKRVPTSFMKNLNVPLPPLEEQHQIVAILEQAEELRRLRSEADRLTEEILPSAFIEMFGDLRENPKGWKTVKLGDAYYFRRHGGGTPNQGGKLMSRWELPEEWQEKTLKNVLSLNQSGTWGQNIRDGERNYPILRSTNMPQGGDLSFDNVAYRYVAKQTARKYTLAPGDVLLNKSSGSKEHIGKICMFKGAPDNQLYLFSNFTQRLRADRKAVLPEYLFFFLKSDFAVANFERMHATSSGLRNINMSLYSSQPVLVPPLEEQQRFGDLVKELQVNQQRQAEARQILDSLYQSLSAQAFTGELTALWREEQKALKVERQAVILALLFRLAQQNRRQVFITALMKYLFLLQVEGRTKGLYHFIPYKYGPFARQVYDDLNVLKERGLITVSAAATDPEKERTEISLRSDHGKEMEQLVQNLPEDVREDAEGIIDLYGELGLKELLDYVYAEYPDYAIRSER